MFFEGFFETPVGFGILISLGVTCVIKIVIWLSDHVALSWV